VKLWAGGGIAEGIEQFARIMHKSVAGAAWSLGFPVFFVLLSTPLLRAEMLLLTPQGRDACSCGKVLVRSRLDIMMLVHTGVCMAR